MNQSPAEFGSVVELLAASARQHGLVIFAGAGLSVPPPSSLPGWGKLNDAFLEAICLRLAIFADPDINGAQLQEYLAQRRENNKVISPDFQAQLAEDECGEDYFRMFQALDVEAWNPGHAVIAALAAAGIVRAVITTNFDRLIELAITAAGQPARVVKDIAGFEEVAAQLAGSGTREQGVLVIKAHGCVADPSSMVDTLRQREKGRPRKLEEAIATLIARHTTLLVGFSGADLVRRPHYLGLAAGAKTCPLFVSMIRAATKPSDEMIGLVATAEERGRLTSGELPQALEELARALDVRETLVSPPWDPEIEHPGLRAAILNADVYMNLAEKLDPLSTANIVAILLQAAGAIGTAAEVLVRTWKHIDNAQGRSDGPFLRYVKLLATHFMEHGLLGPSGSSLAQPKSGGKPAFDLFLYPGADPAHPDSFALAARAAFYTGLPKISRRMLGLVLIRIQQADWLTQINAQLESAHVFHLLGEHESALRAANAGYALARETGDLRALALASAWLARSLARAERWEEVETVLREGKEAAERIQDVLLRTEVEASWGWCDYRKREYAAAQPKLARACEAFQKLKWISRLGETLLDYIWAAGSADRPEEVAAARTDFESILPALPGLEIAYRLWFAAGYLSGGQFAQARQALAYCRALAEQREDVRALEKVGKLEVLVAEREGKAGGTAGE
jgi:hypothetical protein